MSNVALVRIYQQSFESHPNYTLAVTNGTLNALGDVVAQSVQLLVLPIPLILPTKVLLPRRCRQILK